MTPLGISILLHCYARVDPIENEQGSAQQHELERLAENELIVRENGLWKTTERGRAHVIQLCSLVWPTKAWVNRRGEVIKERFDEKPDSA